MELKFKPQRLKLLRKLKGLTLSECDKLILKQSGFKKKTKRFNFDRWEKGLNGIKPDAVEFIATAFDVPIGYFFYEQVDIKIESDYSVHIFIHETKESVNFYCA